MPVIPALRRLRQEEFGNFMASMGYIERPCLKKYKIELEIYLNW